MSDVRLRRLRESLGGYGIDSILVGKLSNVRWLTGFTGDYGYVAVGEGGVRFLTSPLYSEQAREEIVDSLEIIEVKESLYDVLASFGASFWRERIGFEADATMYFDYVKLKKSVDGAELVAVRDVVEKHRMTKTPDEIDAVVLAQRIAEKVFDDILGLLHEGISERDVALEIDYRFRKGGGERSAFDTIVAFGENSSKPHAKPSERRLKYGDIVLFDMGTVIDGYASDMTRTVVFGEPDNTLRLVYRTVLEAQNAAIEAIMAGKICSDIDHVARNIIVGMGYGEQFIHTLGHGVGLDIHESPRFSSRDTTVLEPGMIMTVEPGIYLPGWGGVRIEDMVAVTGSGCENLTLAAKDLIQL